MLGFDLELWGAQLEGTCQLESWGYFLLFKCVFELGSFYPKVFG